MKTSDDYQFKMIINKISEELIRTDIKTQSDLASFKRRLSKKYQIPILSNIKLLEAYHGLLKKKSIKKSEILEKLFKTRPVRSLSGIVNVSILTKPYSCPGKCLYCPDEKGIPKSYLSGEPAVERAKRLKYNPYLQVQKRIEMLELEGHSTDKIELRIIGGTWSYYPKKYQAWFVKECFRACNEFGQYKNSKIKPQNSKLKFKIQNLFNCQRINEKAKHRIVGLSIETRPDFINKEEIKWLRDLGVTLVELGVQSIYDDVLKINLRGHGVKEIVLSTKLLKDAGFKVLYQVMPNLLGSNPKKDEKMFEELFKSPDFQPDYLKIYPTAILKGASLYRWYKTGKYKPYSEKKLIDLLTRIKKNIPYYVRIQRIARDIPSNQIIAGGAKTSNLRQILASKMKEQGWQCKCIRCREVKENYNPREKIFLFRKEYQASDGKEIFLSFEDKERTKLYSFLRLRIPAFILQALSAKQKNNICQKTKSLAIFPALENTAIIREIHTYGELIPIGKKVSAPQHQGLGKKLIKEAEKITKKEFGIKKIAVISGVGVRNYFRKLGYRLEDTFMIKRI